MSCFSFLGAQFDLGLLPELLAPALALGLCMLLLKPLVFHYLLEAQQERNALSWDLGFRLGQISEFSC